jgi:hypothetical protein
MRGDRGLFGDEEWRTTGKRSRKGVSRASVRCDDKKDVQHTPGRRQEPLLQGRTARDREEEGGRQTLKTRRAPRRERLLFPCPLSAKTTRNASLTSHQAGSKHLLDFTVVLSGCRFLRLDLTFSFSSSSFVGSRFFRLVLPFPASRLNVVRCRRRESEQYLVAVVNTDCQRRLPHLEEKHRCKK